MSKDKKQQTSGFLEKFDAHFLNNIVKTVVKNNPNVKEFSERFIDKFNLPFNKNINSENGIRVLYTDEGYIIELYLIVRYGVKIPELAWDLQTQIKNAVEKQIDIHVSKVNIHIQGVSLH